MLATDPIDRTTKICLGDTARDEEGLILPLHYRNYSWWVWDPYVMLGIEPWLAGGVQGKYTANCTIVPDPAANIFVSKKFCRKFF